MGRIKDQRLAAIIGGLVAVFTGGGLLFAIARGSTAVTAQGPASSGDGAAVASQNAVSPATTALLKRTSVKAIVAAIALLVLVALLVSVDKTSATGIWCAWGAGLLLLTKEVLSAFARDRGLDPVKHGLEDWAAICSLFGTVAAVPAVVAAIG